MVRTVSIAGAAFLLLYALASMATGQRVAALGDLAQLIPPLAYAGFTVWLGARSVGQVRTFWNLNAIHGVLWAIGQAVWTYLELWGGAVRTISPTDPLFFVSSIPLAAALYGRPEHERPRWLFDIVLLDVILIALFAAFVYIYFIVTIVVTGGREDLYNDNFRQLMNARNLLLAGWAALIWRTSTSPQWRRVLGIFAAGLGLVFLGGVLIDVADTAGQGAAGSLWDLVYMAPYVVMLAAAAAAWDAGLFEADEPARARSRLPVMSLIAITLLVAIPAIDVVARQFFQVSAATESLRMRVTILTLIPFGIVVVVREFLSRRALISAGQELSFAREQLAQTEKLAAVGQLVSGVAHELNNPLQGVLGYAEMMLDAQPGELETAELKAIRDNANRAAGIVRNMLAFAGRTPSARGWQDINRIVSDAIAMRRPQLTGAGIEVRLDVAEALPLVYVDQRRLEDVFVNLIANAEAAIAARREGKPPSPLVAQRAPGEIVVTTRREPEPDRIVVEVADNGSGLKDEDLSRVFDPFFTTREVGNGTGLGLSICYGVVREHDGYIAANNGVAGGAVFTVALPVLADSAIAAIEDAVSDRPARSAGLLEPDQAIEEPDHDELVLDDQSTRGKMLVVDDEESNAALVKRVLVAAGYDVDSTTLSRRALAMIERTAYDAVIADVRMPELSGPELYRRVCQIRPEMARRFIFITGDIDGDDTRQFLDETRCTYFLKPFNLDKLTAAVATLAASKH